MAVYELAILGDVSHADRDQLTNTIASLLVDFELDVGTSVAVRTGEDIAQRDKHASSAAAYFGGDSNKDLDAARALVEASVPVIPTIKAGEDFNSVIPSFLQGFNGHRRRADDLKFTELATALLECAGLLRRQRRVFVSYRRVESRAAAVQLHDELSSRGYDVFLDTHDIMPADPFQEVLWHRLCDSDVMVMLDTPNYFERKWTRQEIGRARAKEIHVLRVVWPDYTPNKMTDLAETIYLEPHELEAADGPIIDATVDQIVLAVEALRSRSIASRYMSMTGKVRAEVTKIGATFEGVGAHRALAIRLNDGAKIWAYPVVGVPTAELLNDIAIKAKNAEQAGTPILVYDHVGIGAAWASHLTWLDENITSVRAIRAAEFGWTIVGLES
ncbi:toll/interleukin-1 receptor domain-containing protein [uncultured Brevundimonas sp.]|uniref:toll/interleukin-1 receptor domain-containing protein n=1 Tax=uncultured Brevundimonas sp. TaxID=213418 RepID=UPI002614DDF0|nr:toll/interleukin-1 receptor domain-containing protein [uncultured Brevundimonas sp.]